MKQYRQHYKIERLTTRAESAYGFALALVIGICLAYLLASWWAA